MDYELLLNNAIKEREAKREKLQEDMAVLKMHIKQALKNEELLNEIGYNYTKEFKDTLYKLENITLNSINDITNEDINNLDIEYTTTQNLIGDVESSLRSLLGLAPLSKNDDDDDISKSAVIGSNGSNTLPVTNSYQLENSTIDSILGLIQ